MTDESLRDAIVQHLTRPSQRDQQRSVGPSGLADPCDRCLARALHGDAPRPPRGSLPIWIGTAVHAWLADAMASCEEEAITEMSLLCGERPRLGIVRGTADLVLPESGVLVDWKIVSARSARALRGAITVAGEEVVIDRSRAGARAARYVGQIMLYAAGLDRADIPIRHVVLACIPRDSLTTLDAGLSWIQMPVVPGLADAVLDRADRLADPDVDPEEVPSSTSCYQCSTTK